MKRVLLLAVMALTLSVSVKAQDVDLRSIVAVVRPVYYDGSVTFLNNFADMLRKDGYKDAAEWMRDYAKGGFGTGFVYQDSTTKKMYIITNRHVVTLAESVTIEFLGSDKSVAKYENCQVVAVDDKMDLAIVALPEGVARPSLKFVKQDVKDGDDVFTASYPALENKPSWQFGKGVVSNSKFYSETLTGDENVSLLQHTAQIDAGSSGSPLLVKTADGGYLVAGLNTWKAASRENANFAIPAQYIIDFIEKYNKSNVEMSDTQLRDKAEALIKVGDEYKKIIRFLSYEYMAEITPEDFNDWYRICPRDVKEFVVKHFNESNPIEGVRAALAYAISSKMARKKIKVTGVNGSTVTMDYGNKPATSEWVKEHGELRVKNLSFLKTRTTGKVVVATDFGYRSSVVLGATTSFKPKTSSLFSVTFGQTIRTFVTYDGTLKFGKVMPINAKYNTGADSTAAAFSVFGIDLSIGGQLPVRLGPVYLIPYAKPFAGLCFGQTAFLNYGVRGGMEVAYRIKNRNYLLVGVGYRFTGYTNVGFDSQYNGKAHSLDTYIGITF